MRRLLIVVALVGLAGAGAFVFMRPATRFIVAVAAIGADEAVLLTRRNEDDRTWFWVELVKSDGQTRWSTDVSPLQPRDALGFTSVAASADVVVVLGERGARSVVYGLSRATGKKLWEATPSEGTTTTSRIGVALIIDGPRVYAISDTREAEGSQERLVALSLADGATLWSLDPAPHGRMLRVSLSAPNRLLVGGVETRSSVELDGATGKPLRSFEHPVGQCALPRGSLGFDGQKAFFLAGDGSEERSLELGPDWRHSASSPCGARGDDLILGLEQGYDRGLALARFELASGAERWRLELGPRRQFETVVSADGRLPRFLPVFIYGSDGEGTPFVTELITVDLDSGAMIERIRTDSQPVVFATAERAFIYARVRRTLISIDPLTGHLSQALTIDQANLSDVRPDDFQFGQFWLPAFTWARPPHLPWLAIDLTSARPTHANGAIGLTDVTDAGWPR